MADSPQTDSDGIISYTVKTAGNTLDDSVKVISVDVVKAINKIASATLVIQDGDMPTKDFTVSNTDDFKPGNTIEVSVGYDSDESVIFKGVIVSHGISITGQNESKLVIECKDQAIAMTIARKNVNYIKQKDSDIITTLIGNYSTLKSDVDSTTTKYEELVQFNCTDWDFLLSRAEITGLVVLVDDNKVTVQAPDTSGSAVLTVTYGEDLMEFIADVDARHQLKKVKGVAWDIATQAAVSEEVTPQTLNAQGDLTSDDLAKALNIDEYRLQTSTSLETTALKDWATGQQIKSGLSRVCGTMKFQGSAKAIIGSIIEVAGVGNRFNGDLYVSRVNQVVAGGQWHTDIDFGMSPAWSADHRDLSAPPASGLLPAVEGLQVGVVMKLDEDPLKLHRVQVKVPVLQADTEGVWARLATFYASSDFGSFFIPEIGDEVVLGYFNNNPSDPVILGSVYSSKLNPAYDLTADNFTKAIVTKSKLKIEFDDENKVITVITPGENKIVLSDKDKSILLQDQNSNKIEMNDGGITMSSPKDIKITADGTISIEATGKLTCKSSADVDVEGLNVNVTAQAALKGEGSASAEISSSATTTIKGAMVMIN
jgi:Rhs element Vgr protein